MTHDQTWETKWENQQVISGRFGLNKRILRRVLGLRIILGARGKEFAWPPYVENGWRATDVSARP